MDQPVPQNTVRTPVIDGVLKPTPQSQAQTSAAAQPLPLPVETRDRLLDEFDQPDWVQVGAATWRRETWLGNFLSYQGLSGRDPDASPDFNPYSYYAANAADYGDLAEYVLKGDFDEVYSESAFRRKAESLRASLADLDIISRGGIAGMVAGMGASLLDVTALGPFSAAKGFYTASRIVNAARAGAVVAGQAAIQEAGLHALDATRTAEESFLNIGVSTVLGAGIGSLAQITGRPGSPFAPGSADNPLDVRANPKTTEWVEFKLGERPEEGAIISRQSVGAAARNSVDDVLAKPDGFFGKAFDAMRSTLHRFTPTSRAFSYLQETRSKILAMVDLGGVLTRGMLDGKADAVKAPDRLLIYQQWGRAYNQDLESYLREANIAVGQSAAGTSARIEAGVLTLNTRDLNRVERQPFFDAVARRLEADLLEGNGHSGQVEAVKSETRAFYASRGFNDQQIDAIEKHIEKAYTRTKEFLDSYKQRAIKSGLLDEKLDLGDKYGHPIIYNRAAINRDTRGFERIMFEFLSNKPTDEFLEGLGLDAEKFAALDKRARDDVLREWRGEFENAQKYAAALAFEEALKKLARAELALDIVAKHSLPAAERNKKALTIAQVRAHARASEAAYMARKLSFAAQKLDRIEDRLASLRKSYPDLPNFADDVQRTFADAGDALDLSVKRHVEAARAVRETQTQIDVARELREAASDRSKLNAQLRKLYAERRAALEEYRAAKEELLARARESRNANRWLDAVARKLDEHREDFVEVEKREGVKASLDAQLAHLEDLKAKLREAEEARRQAVQRWREVRKGLAITRKEVRAFRRDFTKVRKLRDRIEKAKPLHEYIEQLSEALRGGEVFPNGLLIDKVATSGRLKERKFAYDPQTIKALKDGGFIESDLFTMMDRYQSDFNGRLALQETFGSTDLKDVLQLAHREHSDAADKLRAAGRLKEAEAVLALGEQAKKDITALRDRILGRSLLGGEGDDSLVWAAEKLRQGVFLSTGGGFILSAAADLATAFLSTRGFFGGMVRHFKSYRKLLERAREGDPDATHLSRLLTSMETGAHLSTSLNAFGGNAARVELGFGTGLSQRVTANIDRAMRMLTDRVNVYSGLSGWSSYVRRVAALQQLDNIAAWVGKYDSLSKAVKADLASLGIGESEARKLATLIEKHGISPSKWIKYEDGEAMVEVLDAALIRSQTRSSYVPTAGNVPIGMNKWHWALLMQLQTYAFNFTNNFLIAGAQRALTIGDMRSLQATAMLLVIAGVISEMRAFIRGEDTSTWSTSKWANEVVMRSGLLGWTQPYFDATVKLVGQNVNALVGAEVFTPSAKFQQNQAHESLLGPWFGYLGRLGHTVAAASRGDTEALVEKASRLVPLNQQLRVLQRLDEFFIGD